MKIERKRKKMKEEIHVDLYEGTEKGKKLKDEKK
jgi:hypothetical protein